MGSQLLHTRKEGGGLTEEGSDCLHALGEGSVGGHICTLRIALDGWVLHVSRK